MKTNFCVITRYFSLSAFYLCSYLSWSFTSRFLTFSLFPLSLSLSIFLVYSMASSSSFVVIHRLTSFPVERVCSRFSPLSSSLFAAVVFILSTVCHSICWQTHLFRVVHKRTMMSYFVSVQRTSLNWAESWKRRAFLSQRCFFELSSIAIITVQKENCSPLML